MAHKWISGPPVVLEQVATRVHRQRVAFVRPVGELFAMKVRDIGWMFGRVIVNDLADDLLSENIPPPWPRRPGNHLVYIYNVVQGDLKVIPRLHKRSDVYCVESLTSNPWQLGFVKTVADPCMGCCERIPHVLYLLNIYTNRPDLDNYFCDERGVRIVATRFVEFVGRGGGVTNLDIRMQQFAKSYNRSDGRPRSRVWHSPPPPVA